jgi:hypothetical protein
MGNILHFSKNWDLRSNDFRAKNETLRAIAPGWLNKTNFMTGEQGYDESL